MGLSLGGLGFLSIRNPLAGFVAIVLGKGDLRSLFCLIVCLIISLVLAYLTNPSENSFRAYLTEQSFRLHLSRLDDNAEDSDPTNNPRSRHHSSSLASSNSPILTADAPHSFHFANRASIALRTPKHVFHSFAIFTIAAMVPLPKAHHGENRDGWMISDSWYIGAFGKWWRGGVLEAWYQDVIARTKDEESWSSGILSMKRLDMLQDYNGPTFTAKNLPNHLIRGSPPRLRNRDRPALRHGAVQTRSSTPPPLPKSASLPMHTTRKPSNTERICDHSKQIHAHTHPQFSSLNDPSRRGSSIPSRSSSTMFEHSPLIAEVLRQISAAKTSVLDLRTQLSDCESAASQSRAVLQHEVDAHRNRKRQEDASKIEMKARTKNLEDSKRGAESVKKEAEKKLKAAQAFRDTATQRLDYLDKEIIVLQQGLSEDLDFVMQRTSQISDVEREISNSLEQKRLEIKAAEDQLLTLNQRSRELEDKLASEREKLQVLHEQSDKLKSRRIPAIGHTPYVLSQEDKWVSSQVETSYFSKVGDVWEPTYIPISQPSGPYDVPQTLTDDRVFANGSNADPSIITERFNSQTYMHFDENFSQYEVSNARLKVQEASIGFSLEQMPGVSKSFQSDSDPFIEREWRHPPMSYPIHYQNDDLDQRFPVMPASPISLQGQLISYSENGTSFDARFLPNQDYSQDKHAFVQSIDLSSWGSTDSELNASFETESDRSPQLLEQTDRRRWFGGISRTKQTNGLNPDAKEFSLTRKPVTNSFISHGPMQSSQKSFDALNPNGLGSMSSSSSSTNQSLLRAFAPSPAEREALQRALGGSTNTSFERLPSLSNVASIPASPTSSHALPHISQRSGRELGSILPAWLQTLPRSRKVNFSPWEDEDSSPPQQK